MHVSLNTHKSMTASNAICHFSENHLQARSGSCSHRYAHKLGKSLGRHEAGLHHTALCDNWLTSACEWRPQPFWCCAKFLILPTLCIRQSSTSPRLQKLRKKSLEAALLDHQLLQACPAEISKTTESQVGVSRGLSRQRQHIATKPSSQSRCTRPEVRMQLGRRTL